MKFDKEGKAILTSINLLINHSDYWKNEIALAIKENKERKNARRKKRIKKD